MEERNNITFIQELIALYNNKELSDEVFYNEYKSKNIERIKEVLMDNAEKRHKQIFLRTLIHDIATHKRIHTLFLIRLVKELGFTYNENVQLFTFKY